MASFGLSEESLLERLRLTNVTTTGKVIGKGAYGRVIEVYVHGTLCAAKEVHNILVDHVTPREFEVTKQSFLTECVNASRILHPNVVQVLGVYYSTRQAKLPWLVMEMMETSLRIFLEKYSRDKVPLHFKLSILVDISQGLEFLHGQDIVHRDLSSNNVLLTKHFVAKISDLGVAKVIEHNRMKTHTQTPGTLYFMPPEALSIRPRYGKPVDVFSLACIALHMMSHQWPEPKDRVQEDPVTFKMIALTEVERREQYLHCCTGLKPLVETCLHNQPDQRPPISTVLVELKKFKDSVNKQVPFAIASTIELFDEVRQQKLQIHSLQAEIGTNKTHIGNAEQQISELKYQLEQQHQQMAQSFQLRNKLQQQNHILQQHVYEKDRQRSEAVVNQFREGQEQCQFYIQKVLSAQDQMVQAIDQFHELATEKNLLQAQPLTVGTKSNVGKGIAINTVQCYGERNSRHQKSNSDKNLQKEYQKMKKIICERLLADDYIIQLLMAEYKLPTTNHCEVLVHLVRECNLTLGACLDVAMTNDDIKRAKRFLTLECPICYVEYSTNEMVMMVRCDHALCKDCFVRHFFVMIKEKSIKRFNCPLCGELDIMSETVDIDLHLQSFGSLIQTHLSKEHFNQFTKKVNEYKLMRLPDFQWCIRCPTGFFMITEDGGQIVQCPNTKCGQQMCFQCKEEAHNGVTCEQFSQWKKDNDPELQAQGLAAYLEEEGFNCPSCQFPYAVAKGGCMHVRCVMCPAEFCGGCGNRFKKDCVKYKSCSYKGCSYKSCSYKSCSDISCHHPRDCLFYLRDESVDDLQKLLTDNNVQFDTEPPEGQVMDTTQASTSGEVQLRCRVMLQKEGPGGAPMDEECGDTVQSGHAGLCEKHYKEYLVYKINQNHIDPLPLSYEPGPLRAMLIRDKIKVPDQQADETEEQYCERLRQVIKEKLPLQRIKQLNKRKFIN